MPLSNSQNDQVRRFEKLQILLSDKANIAIYSAYEPFNEDAVAFTTGFAKLKAIIPAKDLSDAHATTTDKNTLRATIAQEMGSITPLVRHYAKKTNNTALANLFHASESDLKVHFAENDLYPYVSNAIAPLTALISAKDAAFAKYKITQPTLDKILVDAKTFDGSIGKADVTSMSSTIANQNIEADIAALGIIVSDMEDLVNYFETSNPDFYKSFLDAKKLEHVGLRHNGLAGTVSQGGKPVSGAKVAIEGTDKYDLSDANGHYAIVKIKTGDHQAVCTLPDGTQKALPFKTKPRTTLDLDFDF